MVKLGKYSRSVSIIGVGCTPFMSIVGNPEAEGLTEGELFGYAALEAMQDAGIESQDIDYYYHGEAFPGFMSDYITPNIHVQDWIGMRGKGSMHHCEACCTGYLALEAAVNAVASGKYNIVLSGAVEMSDSMPVKGKPAHIRQEMSMDQLGENGLSQIYDRAYTRFFGAASAITFDDAPVSYVQEYGITPEQMDDTLNAICINSRRNAARNPLAHHQEEYADIAKKNGFDTAEEYLKSAFNPKMSEYQRLSGIEWRSSGAAALIVCPTEIAHKFKQRPVEILGIGNSSLDGAQTHLEKRVTEEAVRQVYELTGMKPEELDLLYVNDFLITSQLIAAEITGYLPKGKGWKYFIDGRTAFDGDKPINTNGGRCAFGHAYAASGIADYYEAVKQIRGQCGERQVKGNPKTAMLRGFGGGQNATAAIIRAVE